MHKIHAIAEFRHFVYELWSLQLVYACKKKECARCKKYTVYCAESPSDFYHGSGKYFSGYSLDIERVDSPYSSYNHQNGSYCQTLGAIPCKVYAYVMCQNKVSQITGEVPQHVIFIPKALPPHFTKPSAEIRHTCRQQEESNEETFFFCRGFVEPWRYDGHEEVKADEWIHKPQVPRQCGEVQ